MWIFARSFSRSRSEGSKVNKKSYMKSMWPNHDFTQVSANPTEYEFEDQHHCNSLYGDTPEHEGLRQYPDDINPGIQVPLLCLREKSKLHTYLNLTYMNYSDLVFPYFHALFTVIYFLTSQYASQEYSIPYLSPFQIHSALSRLSCYGGNQLICQ